MFDKKKQEFYNRFIKNFSFRSAIFMRVLAINDISCVGKCSLSVTLPILSACGITCDLLPTALLSTHTGGFENYTFRDLTDEIPEILRHWKQLGLKFDFICSGYLGSIEQIEMVSAVKEEFLKKDGKFIVDPVMGDNGKLYAGFSEEYVAKMRALCKKADYILPNATEGCYLASIPYPLTKETAPVAIKKLREICSKPILTGVHTGEGIAVYFTDEKENICAYAHENVPGFFHGAGDVFTSAFVGCLARGLTETQAISSASNFTAKSILRTANEVEDKRYGLNFEAEIFAFLKELNKA